LCQSPHAEQQLATLSRTAAPRPAKTVREALAAERVPSNVWHDSQECKAIQESAHFAKACAQVVQLRRQLVAQTAQLDQENRSHDAFLGDRHLHDFVALRAQAVVATGQFVTTNHGVAYVSRMFTAPEHRQTGCCRALLDTMHAEAGALGMTHSVLVPSLMAWELGVYEKVGYRNCNTIALIVREPI
jgi:predicted GNAT family acetyltransferase